MKLVRITEENLRYAVRIQNTIFPLYNAEANYTDGVTGKADNEYYLVYDGKECIGITGLYHYDIDPESAWLGWFGVLEQYRRRHYGTGIIRLYEDMARSCGYRDARIYTDRYDNDTAIAFYTSCGYTPEIYDNPDDPACYEYPVLIFSKALYDEDVPPWNSRSIGLTAQMVKETMPMRGDDE